MQGLSSKATRIGVPLWVAILALLLAPPAAVAQNGPSALQPGAWSVELGVDIDESSDLLTSLALKRNMGERSALRFGVGVFLNEQDLKGETEDTAPVSSVDRAVRQDLDSWSLFLHYVRYGALSDKVATQFSIGPTIFDQRLFVRSSTDEGTPTFSEFETSQKTKLYGLEVLLGVEWFFASRISLGGQAGLRALTGDQETIQINRSGDGPTYAFERTELSGDATRLETLSSRIVLTGYF